MRLPQTILFLLTIFTLGQALAVPGPINDITEASKQLFKRKGGGGGGGRGGGGSSSGGSRGSGSSSSSSSGSSSSGSRGSGSSSSGGSSSPTRGYGGGRYYGGGAASSYRPGASRGGLGAPLLLGAGAGLLVFPALAAYGAYSYGYPYYWTYRNESTGRNETHPAECLCARYNDCSCDANNETDYINTVANNASQAKLVNNNGNETLVVDGTVPNGTSTSSGAAGHAMMMLEMAGYWPMVAVALATAYAL